MKKALLIACGMLSLAACTAITESQAAAECQKQGYKVNSAPYNACVQQMTEVKEQKGKISDMSQRPLR
ncbi:MAG TPA: hypothetical protein VHB73_01400 [Alphaproteobacteria bacterium]|nr:hypothetical protein [Alphaproteobacteria bacterium]